MIKEPCLYLVISEECCLGRSVLEVAERAIAGGVDLIQMREKNKPARELFRIGQGLSKLCKSKGVIFIVNDDPILASYVGADGVHLGQEDIVKYPVEMARSILGDRALVGLSAGSSEQFDMANGEDVDYIALGPIFPTKLKEGSIGTGDIRHVTQAAKKTTFFIGGINVGNVDNILDLGGRNVAVISAITEAADIESSARELKERLFGYKKHDRVDQGEYHGRSPHAG